MIENLNDGRVKIIAEGDDEKLKWFENAIDIKNTLFHVSSIEKAYSAAGSEFSQFGKFVEEGETDSRLDKGVEVMKEILVAIKDVNKSLDNMNSNLGGKIDRIDGKMDRTLQKQDELLVEVKDMNASLNDKMDKVLDKTDVSDLKSDMAEVKTALRAKGII
jgi:hypothetical protein